MNELKKIITYFFYDILTKIIPFIVPYVIAYKLSPEELGFYTTKLIFFTFAFTLISMGGGAKILVSYAKKETCLEDDLLSLSLIAIGTTVLFSIAFFLIAYVNPDSILLGDYFGIILSAFFYSIFQLQLAIFRSSSNVKKYGLSNLFCSVMIFVIIILYTYFEKTQNGMWRFLAIVYFSFALPVFYRIINNNAKFDNKNLLNCLRFCTFQLPHLLSSWVRLGADRIILANFFIMSVVGYYSLMLQFGLIVSTILQSLNNFYSPYLFEQLSIGKNNKIKCIRSSCFFAFFSIFVAFIVTTGAYIVCHYFMPNQYIKYFYLVPIIAGAYAIQGCYFSIVNYLFYIEKNQLLNIPSVLSCLIHIVLSIVLINRYSVTGAAITLLFSWSIQFLLTLLVLHNVKKKIWP